MPHACYNVTIFMTLSTANTFTYLTIYNVNWQQLKLPVPSVFPPLGISISLFVCLSICIIVNIRDRRNVVVELFINRRP